MDKLKFYCMHKMFFIGFVLLPTIISCTHHEDLVKGFIPGTYTRQIRGQYSKGQDLLDISRANENIFLIIHRSHYERLLNGKWQAPETKSEQWVAIYDEKDKVLREQQKGKIFSFIPEKNELLLGTAEYIKQKP